MFSLLSQIFITSNGSGERETARTLRGSDVHVRRSYADLIIGAELNTLHKINK